MPTGLGLIKGAMRATGILQQGDDPSGTEANDALELANAWIDGLATQRLTTYIIERTTKTLTANTASYTIGSGGSINIVRPTEITNVGLVIDTSASTPTEIPIALFTDDQWAAIPQKTLTAPLSEGIYYDHGWTSGLAIIYPYPIPTVNTTQLVLYCPTALTALVLATTYTFPPGYERFFRLGIAREIAPEFGGVWTQLLQDQYEDAMGNVKRANQRMADLSFDPALVGRSGIYDINSDTNYAR